MIYSPPRPDQIVTFGGERVSVIDGAPSLESVAVSLGRIPRFAGHTRTWYPVLAHVLCCAAYVEDRYGIHALLHDAAESCVNDVPRPMKPLAIEEAEASIMARFYESQGLSYPLSAHALAAVKKADTAMLCAEAVVLGHSDSSWVDKYGGVDDFARELVETQLDMGVHRFLDADTAIVTFTREFRRCLRFAR